MPANLNRACLVAESVCGPGVLLLAAGQSRRFGSDKRRARFNNSQSLLEASLTTPLTAGLPVIVCLGPGDYELAPMLERAGAGVCYCDQHQLGMGATLSQACDAVPQSWTGVLVALADMPWIQPSSFAAVAKHLESAPIVVPVYRGKSGHPVGFARSVLPQLAQCAGDQGARVVVQSMLDQVLKLELNDAGLLSDVDRPEHLQL